MLGSPRALGFYEALAEMENKVNLASRRGGAMKEHIQINEEFLISEHTGQCTIKKWVSTRTTNKKTF
ncbi:hypothetical protein DAPPUDRAFT_239088 [Daphnia pulex]|uniref:Uncharacterized protein n=1 Tax=Daphnia pulex TaxID=6669 RepID=E9G8A7_DAPPU|nr:hypothetical protein DAPPUDRAFT_239088 [Daphnia pulex]|eukprot:EFX84306.1 hypothetical protein DAPPUDRAFT_239088 [Daphnia pulex]